MSEPSAGVPPGDGRRRWGRRPRLAAGAVLVVLLAAGGGAWFLTRGDDTPEPAVATAPPDLQAEDPPGVLTESPAASVPATESPPTLSPSPSDSPSDSPSVDPQRAALAELDALSRQYLTKVTLNGRFAAQLASKNPGTYDKFQTTAAGSHTFRATDILAEFERLRDDPANRGVPVVLLKSTDYGTRQLYHGAPLYVTFALGDFGSADAVQAWCSRRFPTLSGEARENQCATRRLRPPA